MTDYIVGTRMKMCFGTVLTRGTITDVSDNQVFIEWDEDINGNPYSQWHDKCDCNGAPRSSPGVGIFKE